MIDSQTLPEEIYCDSEPNIDDGIVVCTIYAEKDDDIRYIRADITEEEKDELKQTISDMYDLCISDMHDLCMRHIKAADDARRKQKEREEKLIAYLRNICRDALPCDAHIYQRAGLEELE